MTKEEARRFLATDLDDLPSLRTIDNYIARGKLKVVDHVKGKRGKVAILDDESVRQLKEEMTAQPSPLSVIPRKHESMQRRETAQPSTMQLAAVLSRIDTRPLWLTYPEAVQASGLPPTWLKDAAHAGLIVTIGTGRSLRLNRESVMAFAASDGLHGFIESRRQKRATAKPRNTDSVVKDQSDGAGD
jgi:hypothetical protein